MVKKPKRSGFKTLGGLAYYKIGEEMEQVVRYGRNGGEQGDGEMEKDIDKWLNSDTLAKNALAGGVYINDDEDDEDYEEDDDETGIFDDEEDDEDMEDE